MAAIIQPSITGANLSSQTIATDTTTAALGVGVSAKTLEVLLAMKITARTDGTFVNTLQGSQDGTTFVTLKSGSNITAAGTSFVSWNSAVDGVLPPYIRGAIVSTGTTSGATGVTLNMFLNCR